MNRILYLRRTDTFVAEVDNLYFFLNDDGSVEPSVMNRRTSLDVLNNAINNVDDINTLENRWEALLKCCA